jgi:hypothetical protein
MASNARRVAAASAPCDGSVPVPAREVEAAVEDKCSALGAVDVLPDLGGRGGDELFETATLI